MHKFLLFLALLVQSCSDFHDFNQSSSNSSSSLSGPTGKVLDILDSCTISPINEYHVDLVCEGSFEGIYEDWADVYRYYTGEDCPFNATIWNMPETEIFNASTYTSSGIVLEIHNCFVALCNNEDCSDFMTNSVLITSD